MERTDLGTLPAYPRVDRAAISLGGVLASILLHVLLLTPVLTGQPPPKHRASTTQIPRSDGNANEQSPMTLVLIEKEPESGLARGSSTNSGASRLPSPSALLQAVASPNVPPPTDIAGLEDLQSTETGQDETVEEDQGHSMMAGRYLGQIDARIERAWIKPRSPIASDLFACRVRIVQANDGHLQEVEIIQCNGDTAWQTSLVRAIQSASPLPAPPDPKVFSRRLILEFHSAAFAPATNSEGFEPEQPVAMK